MDDRVIGGSQCTDDHCDHKHHADLWNIPTGMLPSLHPSRKKLIISPTRRDIAIAIHLTTTTTDPTSSR